MDNLTDHADTASHVAFAGALNRWIQRAGVQDGDVRADLAVGMADVLNAAARAAHELDRLLQLDPQNPDDADRALTKLGYLNALFLSEMTGHLDDLRLRWEALEATLLATAPDDPEGGSDAPAG